MAVWTAAEYASPLGAITLSSNGKALTGLWLAGQKYFGAGCAMEAGEDPVLRAARAWLDAYFAGEAPGALPPLSPEGSPFRKAVWDLLLKIPRGEVSTYGAIARTLSVREGKRVSPQAVGGAVGHNPISILIPCHRVVGADGSLTGYAGGVEKKLWLLKHEGADVSRLYVPKKGTAL